MLHRTSIFPLLNVIGNALFGTFLITQYQRKFFIERIYSLNDYINGIVVFAGKQHILPIDGRVYDEVGNDLCFTCSRRSCYQCNISRKRRLHGFLLLVIKWKNFENLLVEHLRFVKLLVDELPQNGMTNIQVSPFFQSSKFIAQSYCIRSRILCEQYDSI